LSGLGSAVITATWFISRPSAPRDNYSIEEEVHPTRPLEALKTTILAQAAKKSGGGGQLNKKKTRTGSNAYLDQDKSQITCITVLSPCIFLSHPPLPDFYFLSRTKTNH
jgi:hypothetical protein